MRSLRDAIRTPRPDELTAHAEEVRLEYMTGAILAALTVLSALSGIGSGAGCWAGIVTPEIPVLAGAAFLVFAASWFASSKGYWKFARYVPVAVLLILSVHGTVNGGGSTPLTLLYIVAIVLSAILLGTFAQSIVVIISLSSYIVFSLLHHAGILTPVRSDEAAFYNRLLIVVTSILSLAALVRFLIRQLKAQSDAIIKARADVSHSEAEYQSLFNAIGEGVFIADLSGTIVNVNPAACTQVGFSREELIGRKAAEISARPAEQVARAIEDLVRERVLRFASVHKKKDGTDFPVDLTLTYTEIGGAPRILVIARDTTERLQSDRALRESEQKYRTLFEEAGDAILLMDDATILDCNAQAEVLFGRGRDRIIGHSPVDLSPAMQPGDQPSSRRAHALIDAAIGGRQQNFEWIHTRGDGTPFFAEVSLNSLTSHPGRMLLAIVRDISAQKEAAAAMERARMAAEESSHAKSVLLMNLSHEFRTPLTGILGLSEIISEETKDENLKRQIEGIATSGRRLLNTLESILKLARLSSGDIEITTGPVVVGPVLERVIERFRPPAMEKGLSLSSDAGAEPCVVEAEEETLFTILAFLVDNAVKFTTTGSVSIRVRPGTEETAGYWCFDVHDTGIGIPAENQETIFEEFRQVSEGASRSFEGTGLGLTVARKMARLLGGMLTVASTPGVGSTFTLMLRRAEGTPPARSQEARPAPAYREPRSGPMDVLIVEDNFINKVVMAEALKSICRTEHARNGPTAIRMAREKKYQVILMDINLGVPPDGIQTTQEIRRLPGYEETPIIAVTGYTLPDEREQLMSHGLSLYLPKPFNQAELQDIVRRALL